MGLYSAGGRRKKEKKEKEKKEKKKKKKKKKKRNCGDYSMPGHTIECTYTTGWLDSSNNLSSAMGKQGINSDIPFISHMDEIYHGSKPGPEYQRGACEDVLSQKSESQAYLSSPHGVSNPELLNQMLPTWSSSFLSPQIREQFLSFVHQHPQISFVVFVLLV
jgi:hypothetical protein